jgi:hypothetical protein
MPLDSIHFGNDDENELNTSWQMENEKRMNPYQYIVLYVQVIPFRAYKLGT